jgi:hypothetical protein
MAAAGRIKLDRTGEGFDASLSYYDGYATSPALDLDFRRGLTYANPRIHVLGGAGEPAFRSGAPNVFVSKTVVLETPGVSLQSGAREKGQMSTPHACLKTTKSRH